MDVPLLTAGLKFELIGTGLMAERCVGVVVAGGADSATKKGSVRGGALAPLGNMELGVELFDGMPLGVELFDDMLLGSMP